MNAFHLKNGVLHAESVPLTAVAERFGTPCYVYSRAALTNALLEFQQELSGLDALVCYAMKANSNLAVLNVFARLGAGFDIVSGGELQRALAAELLISPPVAEWFKAEPTLSDEEMLARCAEELAGSEAFENEAWAEEEILSLLLALHDLAEAPRMKARPFSSGCARVEPGPGAQRSRGWRGGRGADRVRFPARSLLSHSFAPTAVRRVPSAVFL